MQYQNISEFGFNDLWADRFAEAARAGRRPARVTAEHRGAYVVAADGYDGPAEISGRLRHDAMGREGFPAVGDWVSIDAAADAAPMGQPRIHAVLPRSSAFSRRAAGSREEAQVIAANIDVAFVVSPVDRQFNLRRIERFLAAAWNSGAAPAIVLTKADIAPDPEAYSDKLADIAIGVPVYMTSTETGRGMEDLRAATAPGRTAVFIGGSGAGKSSLVNCLLGEEGMAVSAVSAGLDRGRHTTTHRQLLRLPNGALVIDTPGLRELQFWGGDGGSDQTFSDIAALADRCRFRDCTHEAEPGCAIRAALSDGGLDEGRWRSWLKLRKEEAYAARHGDRKSERDHDRALNALHRTVQRTSPKR